jgi:hypothetical protein
MLRMVLLGLLIPLCVGVLAAMELRTSPRTAVAVVQPLAETTVGISDSHGALAKAGQLEITYAKSETPPRRSRTGGLSCRQACERHDSAQHQRYRSESGNACRPYQNEPANTAQPLPTGVRTHQ